MRSRHTVRTLHRRTELRAPADAVWSALTAPESFVLVAGGMLRFPAAERHGRRWRPGDEIEGWTLLFGVVPWSRHHLQIHAIDDERRRLESREHGGAIRTWNHVIMVTPLDDGACRYEDLLEIDAGLLTPVVTGFAWLFYGHRQRNWRRLAKVLDAVYEARPGAGRQGPHAVTT
jgi:hypothetical protein